MRARILRHFFTVLGLFAGAFSVSLSAAEDRLPNVVIILADDLGIGDLGIYNPESKAPTPNLDRLAGQGMRFNDSHSPSAVCTPTRYGLLTGRYAWRSRLKSGVLNGYSPALIEPGRETIASLLKAKGYHTACIGKWHLGLGNRPKTDYAEPLTPGPNSVGFDYFFGIPASLDMTPYVYVENERPLEAPTATIEDSAHRRQNGGGFWRGGPIAPSFKHIDVLPKSIEKAVSYIEERGKEKDVPFFLYLPLSAPHTPWLPTDEFRGKSEAGYYGDFVVQVDAAIGRVMAALEAAGAVENTLVIVTSDNGSHWPVDDVEKFQHRANGPFRGQKADIWEGGHRVPLIVRWPGRVDAGSESDQLACHVDFFATVAEAVGEKLPEDAAEDSFSLLPALLGSSEAATPRRTSVVNHSANGTFAIREGDWKLVLGLGSGGFTNPKQEKPVEGGPTGQLYNLAEDIAESQNLFLERKSDVARLQTLLKQIQEQGRSRP